MTPLHLLHQEAGTAPAGPPRWAVARAAGLMQQLGALVPVVAAQARDPVAARRWVDSWARQIVHHQLNDVDLAAGLAVVGDLPADQPFSFPWFIAAAKAARPPLPRLPPPSVRVEDLPGWTPEAQVRGEELMAELRRRRLAREGQP